MPDRIVSHLLSLAGGILGAVLGYYVFAWIYDRGFYGLMIPGALLGFGASIPAPRASRVRGILCGLAALALGVYIEWRFAPFAVDRSIRFLVLHFHEKSAVKVLMLVFGALFAFWIGKDASPFLRPRQTALRGPSDPSVED